MTFIVVVRGVCWFSEWCRKLAASSRLTEARLQKLNACFSSSRPSEGAKWITDLD